MGPPKGFYLTAEEVVADVDGRGLVAIVTGGSSGIGAEAARVLASKGVHVVIAARNSADAASTRDSILQRHPGSAVDALHLDLASLASVRAFASEFLAKDIGLNILINNAGVMYLESSSGISYTADGIERQFGTNHIGHFLLTDLLLERMKTTAKETGIEGRIVNLSSVAHKTPYKCGIKRSFDDINAKDGYAARLAYGQSKLANILHASGLAKKLKAEGSAVTANALHPGIIQTNLWKSSNSFIIRAFIKIMYRQKTVPQGAATTVYVALHPDVQGQSGKYYDDCAEAKPKITGGDAEELEKVLFDLSEKIIEKVDAAASGKNTADAETPGSCSRR